MKITVCMLGILMGWLGLSAQNTDDAYVEKLDRLYKHSVVVIQPADLQEAMDREEKIILLDTRAPGEYAVSHIPGAEFVNYNKFDKKDFKDRDRSAKVVVYCTVGYRSERIGDKLKKMGFEDVHNLYGGIFEWKNQGHSVVDKSGNPTERVHAYNEDWGQWLQTGEKVFK